MRRRVAARLGQSIVVTFIVATISFFVIRSAPGDPFSFTARPLPHELREQLREEFGHNKPVAVQYVRYLVNVAHGNFGYSFQRQKMVSAAIAEALPRTLLLAGVALALTFVIGGVLGVLQATRGGWFDRVTSAVLLSLYSVPDFWGALMISTVVTSLWHGWPVANMVNPVLHDYMGPWAALWDRVQHLILPATSLALLSLAGVARYQRSAMLEVLPSEFIRTARAKGASERTVVWRHALRNALTPMVTILGLTLPAFLGGAVFVERVFAWPGLGSLATDAIAALDYHVVTATVVVGAALVVIGNLIADLLQLAVDPRARE